MVHVRSPVHTYEHLVCEPFGSHVCTRLKCKERCVKNFLQGGGGGGGTCPTTMRQIIPEALIYIKIQSAYFLAMLQVTSDHIS